MSPTSDSTRVRMWADEDDPRHGTSNGYSNLKCRCDRCKKANTGRNRAQRARRFGTLAPDDFRHGRYTTYYNYRCRCRPCKDANAAYYRALRSGAA